MTSLNRHRFVLVAARRLPAEAGGPWDGRQDCRPSPAAGGSRRQRGRAPGPGTAVLSDFQADVATRPKVKPIGVFHARMNPAAGPHASAHEYGVTVALAEVEAERGRGQPGQHHAWRRMVGQLVPPGARRDPGFPTVAPCCLPLTGDALRGIIVSGIGVHKRNFPLLNLGATWPRHSVRSRRTS